MTVSHFCTFCLQTERFKSSPLNADGYGSLNSNGFCGRALGSIFDDSFTLSQALLNSPLAERAQNCETVVESKLWEVEL